MQRENNARMADQRGMCSKSSQPPALPPRRASRDLFDNPQYVNTANNVPNKVAANFHQKPSSENDDEGDYEEPIEDLSGTLEELYVTPDNHQHTRLQPDDNDEDLGYFDDQDVPVPSFLPPPIPTVSQTPQRSFMRHKVKGGPPPPPSRDEGGPPPPPSRDRTIHPPLPQRTKVLPGQRPASDHRSSTGSDVIYEDPNTQRDSGRHTWNETDDEWTVQSVRDVTGNTSRSKSRDENSDQKEVKGCRHLSTPAAASPSSLDLGSLQEGMRRLRKTSSVTGTGDSSPVSVSETSQSQSQSTTSQDVKQCGFNTIRKKFEDVAPQTILTVFPPNVSRAQGHSGVAPVNEPRPRIRAEKPTNVINASTQRPQLETTIKKTNDEVTDLNLSSWFYGEVNRDMARDLLAEQQDGTFLVRRSGSGGVEFPYTLCLCYGGDVFNIQVGLRAVDPMTFALGVKKQCEQRFRSVQELIQFYRQHQLELFKNGRLAGTVYLTRSPNK